MSTITSRSNLHYDAALIARSGFRCVGKIRPSKRNKSLIVAYLTEDEMIMGGVLL